MKYIKVFFRFLSTFVITWQFVVMLGLALFWSPLNEVIRTLPGLLSNSEIIEIGDIKIKIRNKTSVKPSKAISDLLNKLDDESIKELIYFSRAVSTTYSKKYFLESEKVKYENLVKVNLFSISETDTSVTIIKSEDAGKLQDYLFKLIFEDLITFEKK